METHSHLPQVEPELKLTVQPQRRVSGEDFALTQSEEAQTKMADTFAHPLVVQVMPNMLRYKHCVGDVIWSHS